MANAPNKPFKYDHDAPQVYDNGPFKPQDGDRVMYYAPSRSVDDRQEGISGRVDRIWDDGASVQVEFGRPGRPGLNAILPTGSLALVARATL